MPEPISDPLHDPRVIAARARLSNVERVRERFAEPTAEVAASSQTATLRIYGRIDSDGAPWGISAQDVAQALDALPDSTTRLDVHIHSRGGDAFDGLAILNLLQQAKPEVHTHVDGLAASAASAIAMAGKTVTLAPSAQLMIHDASGIGVGQAADMRLLADALDSVSESYAAAYAARTGGDPAEWRAAMQPETWYRAEEAVTAGLADHVSAAAAPEVAASLDLSIFAYAGRDAAPEPFMPTATQTPADQPVTPSTDPKEADTMSDTLLNGLRQQLGLPDADEATALAALAEALTERADPPAEITPTAVAQAYGITAEQAKAALDGAKAGKVTVSQAMLDTLKAGAEAGKAALQRQTREDRDKAIAKAQFDGKLGKSESEVKAWQAAYDRDPEGTAQELEDLGVRFPVGPAAGYAGHDDDTINAEVMTEAEAKAVAARTGVDYRELMSA